MKMKAAEFLRFPKKKNQKFHSFSKIQIRVFKSSTIVMQVAKHQSDYEAKHPALFLNRKNSFHSSSEAVTLECPSEAFLNFQK